MFFERLIDDVERISELPTYKYFRRAAKPLRGEQVAGFKRRREHGAPKDKKGTIKNISLLFVRILLESKMMYSRNMDFPFVLTTEF